MRQKSLRPFEESVAEIRGRTVLLDVDGTILPDGASEISGAVREAVAKLRQENAIYLASNGNDVARVARLAHELKVGIVPAGVPAGKPFKRAARGLTAPPPFLVIGDKLVTDGLFAYMLEAPFLHVRPKRSKSEKLSVRLSYILENIVSLFV
ncbi:hypothetical protein HYV30_04355 [Candidatus Kaiserbacteria bacterium]|nr:hypothetical protein [Candidatus Kaiserbacteria bacterium]